MSDVYENCPAFENDKFLLRFSQLDDAEDLVSVYSDKNALPFFNSDNCHGDNFYYPNEDRMRQAIKFWLSSYSSKWFVRWTIIDKEKHEAIGTIEVFHRSANDNFIVYSIITTTSADNIPKMRIICLKDFFSRAPIFILLSFLNICLVSFLMDKMVLCCPINMYIQVNI